MWTGTVNHGLKVWMQTARDDVTWYSPPGVPTQPETVSNCKSLNDKRKGDVQDTLQGQLSASKACAPLMLIAIIGSMEWSRISLSPNHPLFVKSVKRTHVKSCQSCLDPTWSEGSTFKQSCEESMKNHEIKPIVQCKPKLWTARNSKHQNSRQAIKAYQSHANPIFKPNSTNSRNTVTIPTSMTSLPGLSDPLFKNLDIRFRVGLCLATNIFQYLQSMSKLMVANLLFASCPRL